MNKKGDMGIGTLIIFIAMILVAAIAAGVLVQTATSLQNKALLSGERTKGQVSTALQFLLVYAEDGTSVDKALSDFFFKTKLVAGSDPIKFEDALVEFDLQDSSADLNFVGGTEATRNCSRIDGDVTNSGYYTDSTGSGNYSVEYLVKGPDWKDGYMHRGDVVRLCMQSPRNVTADEDVQIRFIPKVGTTALLETAIPDAITQKRVYIFP